MDPSSISIASYAASALYSSIEFLGKNAFILFLYTVTATIAMRLISRANREFSICGTQVAEFFRFAEK